MLLAVVVAILTLLAATTPVEAAFCHRALNTTYPPNMNPIYDEDPVFVKSVPNGEMYSVGTNESRIHVLHVYGSNGYDFGYAAGQLLGDMARSAMDGLMDYFHADLLKEVEREPSVRKYNLTEKQLEILVKYGLEILLDIQNAECEPFMNPEWYAEIRGMADGSGVSYGRLKRIHMLGELTKAACSFYGAYGSATLGGKVLQLRSLDWNMGTGIQNYPTVTVYHPSTPTMGTPFANVGWAGWVGVLTGMGANRLGITSIGIDMPGPNFGNDSSTGIPFIFLNRNIIQYGTSVYNAMDMLENANRTCRLVIGVADGNAKTAREAAYSGTKLRIFNDTTLLPLEPWHPRLEDVVYNGMDWLCPYFQYALYRQLSYAHGKLTPELSIQNVTSVVGTGDLHTAVYDLTDNFLYVANARGVNQTGHERAFNRQFVKMNMTMLFSKPYGQ